MQINFFWNESKSSERPGISTRENKKVREYRTTSKRRNVGVVAKKRYAKLFASVLLNQELLKCSSNK